MYPADTQSLVSSTWDDTVRTMGDHATVSAYDQGIDDDVSQIKYQQRS
jgi:hypothetical protein